MRPRMSIVQVPRDWVLDRLLSVSPLLSALGLAGLFATIALGFEEPNRAMLIGSACLLLTAPLAVVTHVAVTHHLTTARRRTWLRSFGSAKALSAMSRYLRLSRCWV
jgi:hypothetical protein